MTHNRRSFITTAGAAALAAFATPKLRAAQPQLSTQLELRTGNGEWTYRLVPNWGSLPTGTNFGGTHGAIATDNAGLIYVSTQSATGIVVYDQHGTELRTIAHDYPEVHNIHHAVENGEEFFYTVVQHGTPTDNWFFLKMKLDGTPVQKITAPPEAGFKTPNEWHITAAVPGPDGSIYIANGYGDSRIFRFSKTGEYLSAFAGKGTDDGLCKTCHGLVIDTRYDQPLLLVCDRENRRLTHFDLDGKFVRHVALHMRRPCQVSFHSDYAVVSELEGRVTVLDKDHTPVAFLGDNPDHTQWANYKLDPATITPACFSAAHGCFIDSAANIYISDWNHEGRVTRLERIKL